MNSTPSLFDIIEEESISLKNAAEALSVSVATIRNWIKEGYLNLSKRGYVTMSSFKLFKDEHVGKSKLVSRSNKLYKTSRSKVDNDPIVKLDNTVPVDLLGSQYEQMLPESFRNQEGIYYTPERIANDMIQNHIKEDALFLDPCCGSGNFLLKAIELGVSPSNIYGFDTDPNAVIITKQRIKAKTGFECENIVCGNFLEMAKQLNLKFTYIFTNPPWGKKISKEKKEYYSSLYHTGESTDTSSIFYFAAASLLAVNGIIGFLLPEAVLNIGSYEDHRKALLNNTIISIVDYGKPFKGVFTKAYAVTSSYSSSKIDSMVRCCFEGKQVLRTQASFISMPKHIFNIWINENHASIISKIYSFPHITLANHAQWALGIVTGNNKKYCLSEPSGNSIPVYRGKDITKNGLLPPAVYIENDFSKYQQVAPMSMYLAKPKLIYRFISDRLIFYNDNTQAFVLNSANIIVPNSSFPFSSGYLAEYFNGDFANWLFNALFHTHKILRGDIEQLPLFNDCPTRNDAFNENKLLKYLGISYSDLK